MYGLESEKKIEILRKSSLKVVQMKFLAMRITNQKLSFDIFSVGNLQNILMECDLWHKRKINNFDPYNLLLAIIQIYPCYL